MNDSGMAVSVDQARTRGGNPATAERYYDPEESDLLRAVDGFRCRHRRLPTVTEMFRLFKGLDHARKVEGLGQLRPPVNPAPAVPDRDLAELSHEFRPNRKTVLRAVA